VKGQKEAYKREIPMKRCKSETIFSVLQYWENALLYVVGGVIATIYSIITGLKSFLQACTLTLLALGIFHIS